MRYPKYYTVKQWKKFDRYAERIDGNDITWQEVLLRKYDVILTDHKTKMDKLNEILDKFTFQNLDKTLTKVSNGIDKFAKAVEAPKPKKKRSTKRKPKTQEPDYSFLFSNKPKFF